MCGRGYLVYNFKAAEESLPGESRKERGSGTLKNRAAS